MLPWAQCSKGVSFGFFPAPQSQVDRGPVVQKNSIIWKRCNTLAILIQCLREALGVVSFVSSLLVSMGVRQLHHSMHTMGDVYLASGFRMLDKQHECIGERCVCGCWSSARMSNTISKGRKLVIVQQCLNEFCSIQYMHDCAATDLSIVICCPCKKGFATHCSALAGMVVAKTGHWWAQLTSPLGVCIPDHLQDWWIGEWQS